jgi:hypothetical protein
MNRNKPSNYTAFTEAIYGDSTEELRKRTERNRKAQITRATNRKLKLTEFDLAVKCAKYLNRYYPDVMFDIEYTSELNLTAPQRGRYARIQCGGFKRPDVIIFNRAGNFEGLAIELKKDSPFKKTNPGELLKSEHNEAQKASLTALSVQGYLSMFLWQFDAFTAIIRAYMNGWELSEQGDGWRVVK